MKTTGHIIITTDYYRLTIEAEGIALDIRTTKGGWARRGVFATQEEALRDLSLAF